MSDITAYFLSVVEPTNLVMIGGLQNKGIQGALLFGQKNGGTGEHMLLLQ